MFIIVNNQGIHLSSQVIQREIAKGSLYINTENFIDAEFY